MLINIILSVFIVVISTTSLNASVIAVIDSGTDMNHELISPKAWVNPTEIPNNDRDEDENGYQDDVHGWNFAESNNQVIDYSYLGLLNDDIRRFFEIQARMIKGEATDEEIAWLKENIDDVECPPLSANGCCCSCSDVELHADYMNSIDSSLTSLTIKNPKT